MTMDGFKAMQCVAAGLHPAITGVVFGAVQDDGTFSVAVYCLGHGAEGLETLTDLKHEWVLDGLKPHISIHSGHPEHWNL